jgi:hypothetical protein
MSPDDNPHPLNDPEPAPQTPSRRSGRSRKSREDRQNMSVAMGAGVESPYLITREQAAELLQVSMTMLEKWSFEPGFPIIREGPHFVRIIRPVLLEWVANRARIQEPPPTPTPTPPPVKFVSAAEAKRVRRQAKRDGKP